MADDKVLPLLFVGSVLTFVVAISPFFLISSLSEWMNSWQVSLFSMFCHQDLFRSFQYDGIPAAVCGRCLGIYGGLVVGFSSVIIPAKRFTWNIQTGIKILVISSVILVADGIFQWIDIYEGSNILRAFTGLFFGTSVSILIVALFQSNRS